MYTIFIYNNDSKRLERYKLEPYHRVPYTSFNSLSASEFFSHSISTTGWTSTDFLTDWTNLSKRKALPSVMFRRMFEGGFVSESMHYAGLAVDTRESLPSKFAFQDGTHHASFPPGYPEVSLGDTGLFVLVLQDALACLGYKEGELDGIFGPLTLFALTNFCKDNNLVVSRTCSRDIWRKLSFLAAGSGVNSHCKYVRRDN